MASSTLTPAAKSLYEIPPGQETELEQLREMIGQYKSGAIPAARLQAFRVPLGVYEQRESGTYMLRVRLPAGMIRPQDMRAAARIAQQYGNGTLHITSRQDLQIHGVPLDSIHPAEAELAKAGLSTKGGGGNTVRNVAACHLAGVCAKEVFDVTPHVIALTERLLRDPISFQLPRKYKIAFSGCGDDCAGATVNDLGFISRQKDGVDGFAVYVAGGMGARSRVGTLLEEFVPAGQIVAIAEAIKRVFDKHGNRKNRHHARLRFLLEDIGIEKLKELYRQELAAVPVPPTTVRPVPTPAIANSPAVAPNEGFEAWRVTNTQPQRQAGFHVVEIPLPLGFVEASRLAALADVVETHGEGMLRATNWQTAVLRWVPEAALPSLHAALKPLAPGESLPVTLRRMVACAGASTCRLGICLARGVATAIADELRNSGLQLTGAAGDLSLNISGCPNACGRHPVADIGLYGGARRVNGRLAPHYTIQFGGKVREGTTTLATGADSVPARNVPKYIVEFIRAFQASPQSDDFAAFLAADGRKTAAYLARKHADLPEFDTDNTPYFDWGATEPFSLAGRGPGECGAGVFDLIEVDLASADDSHKSGRLFAATVLASRALLVTRGEQADNDAQSLHLFQKHFVEANVLPAEHHAVVQSALQALTSANPEAAFVCTGEQVAGLIGAVKALYTAMGPSLRVSTPTPIPASSAAAMVAADVKPDMNKDFRGVVCPLNYVKTKLALGMIKPGQVLQVLLDEQGAKNVPESAAKDGHHVLGVVPDGGHWKVLIRRA